MDNCKLFVGGLSYSATKDDIMGAFAPYGTVTDIFIVNDRETRRPKGFGFVTFETPEEAQAAIEGLHETEFMGRTIFVNVARPREER